MACMGSMHGSCHVLVTCAGVLGFQDGAVIGAVVAVVLVHVVLAAYIYVALTEGKQPTSDEVQEQKTR